MRVDLYVSEVKVWASKLDCLRGEAPIRLAMVASYRPIGMSERLSHTGAYWQRPECPRPVYRFEVDWAGDDDLVKLVSVDQLLSMVDHPVPGVRVEKLREPARFADRQFGSARRSRKPVGRDLPGQAHFRWGTA